MINPFRNFFALDISERQIKVLELIRRPVGFKKWRYQVKFQTQFQLAPNLIVNGEIQKPELIIAALQESLFKQFGRRRVLWVSANLPESKTFIKRMSLKTPAGVLSPEAVKEAAAAYLPFSLDEVYFDWRLLTPARKSSQSEILFAAVPKKIADSYTYLLSIAGLTPLALEVEALALERSLISRQNAALNEAAAIIDLGANHSSLIIYDLGSVQFSISLPFFGEKIDQNLAQYYQVTLAEAEKIKIGLASASTAEQKKINQLLADDLEELVSKVKEAFQFYNTHFPRSQRVGAILLSGGLAQLAGLDKIFSLKLKIKTQLADPTINLGLSHASPVLVNPALATVIGLALAPASRTLPMLNLLPPEKIKQLRKTYLFLSLRLFFKLIIIAAAIFYLALLGFKFFL